MPTVNKNIDFNFFSRSGRVPPKVRFNVWGSACGLSVDAYNALVDLKACELELIHQLVKFMYILF